ncbi:MAG: hypothetical protein Ct9H90mP2_10980 [Dehalococcoidia bacterium]|nr:MAG: hypothetical protein Ct9H90mP2_10980 [Dehalococcoidia bacterium]
MLFSFDSYKKNLEALLNLKKKKINSKSVASFFISRIDTAVDQIIDNKNKFFHKWLLLKAYKAKFIISRAKKIIWGKFSKIIMGINKCKSKKFRARLLFKKPSL